MKSWATVTTNSVTRDERRRLLRRCATKDRGPSATDDTDTKREEKALEGPVGGTTRQVEAPTGTTGRVVLTYRTRTRSRGTDVSWFHGQSRPVRPAIQNHVGGEGWWERKRGESR